MSTFSKEEIVAFEDTVEGFDDTLQLVPSIKSYKVPGLKMVRAGDVIFRPMRYYNKAGNSINQTGLWKNNTQLTVPAGVDTHGVIGFEFSAKEMIDNHNLEEIYDSAKVSLASTVNQAIATLIGQSGTLVIPRTGAASGYADLSKANALMDELGIQGNNRFAAISSTDLNDMGSELVNKQDYTSKTVMSAYDSAIINSDVAGFKLLKSAGLGQLPKANGVTCTVAAINQYYVPVTAHLDTVTGRATNVDNRSMPLTIGVTSGTVAVGDAFTLPGVYSLNMVTKKSTGFLQTFRITSIVSGGGGSGVVMVSPPIISGTGGSDAEKQYQNCNTYPANGSPITWLNVKAASPNLIWHKDSVEFIPGISGVYEAASAGNANTMRAVTAGGIELVVTKSYNNETTKTNVRFDMTFGVVNLNPAMNGIILFGQTP